jgi:uncharacterized protein YecT (DUF1311 family)
MSLRSMSLAWACLISLATYTLTLAQSAGEDCAALSTNVEMKQCLYEAYEKADAELNAIWPQILASVDQADYLPADKREAWKTELREAQRGWVQFKDHDCSGAVLYEWWGGSGAGGAISECLLNHTTARIADLKSRYLDKE